MVGFSAHAPRRQEHHSTLKTGEFSLLDLPTLTVVSVQVLLLTAQICMYCVENLEGKISLTVNDRECHCEIDTSIDLHDTEHTLVPKDPFTDDTKSTSSFSFSPP